MPTVDLAARLAQLGYFDPPGGIVGLAPSVPSPDNVADALHRYADFHGLPTADPRTVASHMALPRCGRPDFAARADDTLCRWPHKAIRFWAGVFIQGYEQWQVNAAYKAAIDSWGDVCGIEPTVGFGPTAKGKANVVAEAGKIDGPANTLAYAYLPCGVTADTQLTQLYDSLDAWLSYGLQFFQGVVAHETGHSLGLDHLPAGNLLQPTAKPGLYLPQPGDIAEVVARYGKPAAQPVPTPTPAPNPTPTPGPSGTRLATLRDVDGSTIEIWSRP